MLSREFVPSKMGFFDEEDFLFVPAGDLNAKAIDAGDRFRQHRGHLGGKRAAFGPRAREEVIAIPGVSEEFRAMEYGNAMKYEKRVPN